MSDETSKLSAAFYGAGHATIAFLAGRARVFNFYVEMHPYDGKWTGKSEIEWLDEMSPNEWASLQLAGPLAEIKHQANLTDEGWTFGNRDTVRELVRPEMIEFQIEFRSGNGKTKTLTYSRISYADDINRLLKHQNRLLEDHTADELINKAVTDVVCKLDDPAVWKKISQLAHRVAESSPHTIQRCELMMEDIDEILQ